MKSLVQNLQQKKKRRYCWNHDNERLFFIINIIIPCKKIGIQTEDLNCNFFIQSTVLSDNEEIIKIIETLFESGITKDLSKLRDIHLNDPKFSSFSDLPPYDLKDYQNTIELEELRFVSISDYSYEIKNPKISIFGNAAIVAMELVQKGMLIDNKAYTGEHMMINGRATFVLIKQPTWKIAHIHLSKIS